MSLLAYRFGAWVRFHLSAWNTGGNGVHSPYLFEWVRMVMSDKHGYYDWQAIEARRDAMLRDERILSFVDYGSGKRDAACSKQEVVGGDERSVKDIAKGSLSRKRYAQMLYRLVNWLGNQREKESAEGLVIVELGTSLGITTAYLAATDSRNSVVSYEGCDSVAAVARENWEQLGLENIVCRVGEISVEDLARDFVRVDLAFIDANHTYAHTREYFNVLANKVHEKSVIVVDDIYHSAEMEEAWKAICEDDRVTTTMDLFQMGLVFFDTNYLHRNYKMRL